MISILSLAECLLLLLMMIEELKLTFVGRSQKPNSFAGQTKTKTKTKMMMMCSELTNKPDW